MTSRFVLPDSLEKYAGFIFDCDGTLADTMPAHFQAWQQALREGGGTFEFTWSLFVSRAGMSMERTVFELSEQFQVELDQNVISQRQREIFDTLTDQVHPVVDVLALAQELARTHPVSVASGSSRPSVDRTLRAIGALDLFPIIVTPEDVAHGKPSPEMFLLAAKKMGIEPSSCLVFEDGALGILAAQNAKMDCVIVACEEPSHEGKLPTDAALDVIID